VLVQAMPARPSSRRPPRRSTQHPYPRSRG
jgi:hypothetical protein